MTDAVASEKAAQLRKILELEASKGFTDQAVAGGLDRFLAKWRVELARSLGLDPTQGIPYGRLTPERREAWAERILKRAPGRAALSLPRTDDRRRQTSSAHHPQTSGESRPAEPGPGVSHLIGGPVKHPARAGRHPATTASTQSPPRVPAPRTHRTASLDSAVVDLKLCTQPAAKKLAAMGVVSLRDILYFFPNRHIDYATVSHIRDLQVGVDASVIATVWEASEARIGPPPGAARAIVSDGTGTMEVTWFRQRYLAGKMPSGTRLVLSGKVGQFRGRLQFQNPEYEVLGEAREGDDLLHAGNLLPVYPSTEGLAQRTLRNMVKKGLDLGLPMLQEFLPRDVIARHDLQRLPDAISGMHLPSSATVREIARRRLAFDELFLNQLAVQKRRLEWRRRGEGVAVTVDRELTRAFLSSLDFELTGGQSKALDEILGEIERDIPMGRLLQGEVGSGKTIVAIAALVAVASAGYQGAIMAPTEVLAEQHFLNLTNVLGARPVFGQPDAIRQAVLPSPHRLPFDRLTTQSATGPDRQPPPSEGGGEGAGEVRIALLIGSLPPRTKSAVQRRISDGEIDLIVGTHALIEEAVLIPKLAMAVVDEQHRFGVEQRAALKQKGLKPHLLAMSATPIPRSLALTLYGDLDLSTLSELPKGRRPIDTRWMRDESGRAGAYDLLRKEITSGRQAFVVCPLIDPSEEIKARSVSEEHPRLSGTVFPDLRVGLLHGRMPLAEKQAVMERFRAGDIQVLVATPVIEVGIDIPNATVMLVESADRFGLSQLHQLRGRVGRGAHKSYCILLADDPSAEAQQRLAIVERTSDGFQLAEKDLDLRGPGDYLGTRQSGFADLKVAKLSDFELLSLSRSEAERLLGEDPGLRQQGHEALAGELARVTASRPAEIS